MSRNGPGQCGCGAWDSYGVFVQYFAIHGGIVKMTDYSQEVDPPQVYFPDSATPSLGCSGGAYPDRYTKQVIVNSDSETSPDNSGARTRTLTNEWSPYTNVALVNTDVTEYLNEHTTIPNPARPWVLDSETVTHSTATRYRVVREYSFSENGETGTWTSIRDIQLSQIYTFQSFLADCLSLYTHFTESELMAAAPDNVEYLKHYWRNSSGIIEEISFTITDCLSGLSWWPVGTCPDAWYMICQTTEENNPQFQGARSIRPLHVVPSTCGHTLLDEEMNHKVAETGVCAAEPTVTTTPVDLTGYDYLHIYCSTFGYEIVEPIP